MNQARKATSSFPLKGVFAKNERGDFLLIDATDRRKISSDQRHFFIALSLYPLSFFANTPFNCKFNCKFANFLQCNVVPVVAPHLATKDIQLGQYTIRDTINQ